MSSIFYPSSNVSYNVEFPVNNIQNLISGISGSTATMLVTLDDGSGRQKWLFNPIYTTSATVPAYYNIVIFGGGTSATYLSCSSNGATIDLTSKDDGSGRQRWVLAPVASPSAATSFSIQVQGGVSISGSSPPYYIVPSGASLAFTTTLASAQQWQVKVCPKYI